MKSGIGYIEKELGTIDILVCNAAWIGNISLIENMPAANWQKEPSVNLSGPFYLVKEVMPGMVLVD